MRVLSPYYITVPFVAPLSGLVCTEFILNIYIWSGLKSAVPSIATYQITKDNPTASSGSTKIDVSKLVADFIDFDFVGTGQNEVLSSENQVWVKTSNFYETTNPLDLTTQQNESIELASKGYISGFSSENSPIGLGILISNIEYKIYNSFVVPVRASETTTIPYTVISYPNNELNISGTIPATTNSNDSIKNIWVSISPESTEEYIEVKYFGGTVTLIKEHECRYFPNHIVFQNEEGALSFITFFKKKVETLDVTSEEFESDRGQPIDGFHQYTNYNIQGRKKFTLSSGFVEEEMNSVFRQLLLSERVWWFVPLFGSGYIKFPVNVESRSIEYKTRENDRLINYTINFKYSYNEINNI